MSDTAKGILQLCGEFVVALVLIGALVWLPDLFEAITGLPMQFR